MTIQIDHAELRGTTADVRVGADSLRATSDDIHLDVEALLDAGWTGTAAESYADAWADWRSGADRVLDALTSMADLLEAVHVDLTERDLDAAVAVDDVRHHVPTRITERLG